MSQLSPAAGSESPKSLRAWRWLWLIVVGLTVLLALATWPIYLSRLGETCGNCPITPELGQALNAAGFQPGQWAARTLVVHGAVLAGWVGMGMVVFVRRPHDPRALLMAALLALTGAGFGGYVSEAVWDRPAWLLVGRLLSYVSFACFMVLPLVIPNGRVAPRWTLGVAVPTLGLFSISFMFPDSPLGFTEWPWTVQYTVIPLILALIVVVIPAYRYARVLTTREREQMKWVLLGLALAVAAVLVTAYVSQTACQASSTPEHYLACRTVPTIGYGLGPLMIPVFIGVAILRSRLWDIDLIFRRTLAYSVLTGLLALAYFGSILSLQSMFGSLTGNADTPLVTVLSTLAIAVLFFPLRARVQGFIDRRFFRRKYDAAQTLAAFASAVRDETDLRQLTAKLTGAVHDTMQPEQISLWLPGKGPR